MTKDEAISVLDRASAIALMSRQDHITAVQAIEGIKGESKPDIGKNKKAK